MAALEEGLAVSYEGTLEVPGVPTAAAPVTVTTYGITGSQTGHLLPTGRAVDRFDLGDGLGEVSGRVQRLPPQAASMTTAQARCFEVGIQSGNPRGHT